MNVIVTDRDAGLARHLRGGAARCLRAVWRIDIFTARWRHVFGTVLAAALALGLAYGLDVESPYSAASTVLLVANPIQGAVRAKGAWRIVGTCVGGVVAFVLLALFVQTPVLFLLGLGLWLGLCTGAAMLLRHFRASGAAVAGYTIGLATYGALEHPQLSFEQVVGRGATVVLGVACLGIVTALLTPRGAAATLEAHFARLVAATGRLIARHVPDGAGRSPEGLAATVGELFTVDDHLVLSAAETADIALRAGAVREGLAALFVALIGATALPATGGGRWRAWRARAIAAQALKESETALASPQGVAGALRSIAAARHALAVLAGEGDTAGGPEDPADLIALDRLAELLRDYELALIGLAGLRGRRLRGSRRRFRFHRDYRGAIDNGLRSLLAIGLGSAFWIVTGWHEGMLALLILSPYCALLAMTGNPAAGAAEFVKGTIVAVPAGFICAYGMLPAIDGFPLLVVALAPFWIAGLYATTLPKHGAAGLAYLVAFNTLVAASNPMAFDPAAFLNHACGWLGGVLLTLLCFRILLPRDPPGEARRLAGSISADVLALLRSPGRLPDRFVWGHLQHHRLSRISLVLRHDPQRADAMVLTGIAQLQLGHALFRAQAAAGAVVLPRETRDRLAQACRAAWRLRDRPARMAAPLEAVAGWLAALPEAAGSRETIRAMAALEEVAGRLKALANLSESGTEPRPC